MTNIPEAVSIVLVCQDELLVIKRQAHLKAFPGYWAFPGGKVEKTDTDHWAALSRETKEELGIDLDLEKEQGNLLALDFLGLAITPSFNPIRFATHFYKIELKTKPLINPEKQEIDLYQWSKGDALVSLYEKGRMLVVPPVYKVIKTFALNKNLKRIDDLAFSFDENLYVPMIENLCGIKQLMPLSNTLPPAKRTNAFLIGDQGACRVLVDPSPKDLTEKEKLKRTAEQWGVDKIFLTHHHPDHYEFSADLARDWKVPIGLSRDTQKRIESKKKNYFEGIKIEHYREGDELTVWLGQAVKIYEVPGHDQGQLALAPIDQSWFLAGDLFQGVGTVVIGGDEGNMSLYMKTLEKVIQLNPQVIFPSHGIGLGGVYILEKTLEHRKLREQQVLDLTLKGFNEDKILETLYSDVAQELWPYARENIRKHLEKLRAESKIN